VCKGSCICNQKHGHRATMSWRGGGRGGGGGGGRGGGRGGGGLYLLSKPHKASANNNTKSIEKSIFNCVTFGRRSWTACSREEEKALAISGSFKRAEQKTLAPEAGSARNKLSSHKWRDWNGFYREGRGTLSSRFAISQRISKGIHASLTFS